MNWLVETVGHFAVDKLKSTIFYFLLSPIIGPYLVVKKNLDDGGSRKVVAVVFLSVIYTFEIISFALVVSPLILLLPIPTLSCFCCFGCFLLLLQFVKDDCFNAHEDNLVPFVGDVSDPSEVPIDKVTETISKVEEGDKQIARDIARAEEQAEEQEIEHSKNEIKKFQEIMLEQEIN